MECIWGTSEVSLARISCMEFLLGTSWMHPGGIQGASGGIQVASGGIPRLAKPRRVSQEDLRDMAA